MKAAVRDMENRVLAVKIMKEERIGIAVITRVIPAANKAKEIAEMKTGIMESNQAAIWALEIMTDICPMTKMADSMDGILRMIGICTRIKPMKTVTTADSMDVIWVLRMKKDIHHKTKMAAMKTVTTADSMGVIWVLRM